MADWTIDEIREKLQRLEKKGAFHKPEFYRQFTEQLKEHIQGIEVVKADGTLRPVDVVFASPERAIAKFNEQQPHQAHQTLGIE